MELAVQLRRDWKPQLDGLGIKLVLVSIGTYEKSLEFAKTTGFPTANLFVDPEVASYTALGMYKGVGATFFNAETPKAILQRMKEGKMQDIKDMVKDWSPSAPPITNSVLQQGGMFVFEGDRCTFAHYDKATGAHLAMDTVLAEVNKLAVARGGAGRATPR